MLNYSEICIHDLQMYFDYSVLQIVTIKSSILKNLNVENKEPSKIIEIA